VVLGLVARLLLLRSQDKAESLAKAINDLRLIYAGEFLTKANI